MSEPVNVECNKSYVNYLQNISFDFRQIGNNVFRMRKYINGKMVDAYNGTQQECFDYFNIQLTT